MGLECGRAATLWGWRWQIQSPIRTRMGGRKDDLRIEIILGPWKNSSRSDPSTTRIHQQETEVGLFNDTNPPTGNEVMDEIVCMLPSSILFLDISLYTGVVSLGT